jgi:hypothetical protein
MVRGAFSMAASVRLLRQPPSPIVVGQKQHSAMTGKRQIVEVTRFVVVLDPLLIRLTIRHVLVLARADGTGREDRTPALRVLQHCAVANSAVGGKTHTDVSCRHSSSTKCEPLN